MKRLSREHWIRAGFLVVCCAIVIICSISVLNRKEALFLDEYYSYGCANGTYGRNMKFEEGVTYTPEELEAMILETYGVTEGRRFNFGKVWNNLKDNVHPPVFYAALHLACSLTPGQFTLWQAAWVNIVFGLITLLFFHKISRELTGNEWLAGILTVCFALTQGLYRNIIFLRDYSAAMCGASIAAWEGIRYLRGHRKVRDMILFALACAFSALCHYYCLIWLFFFCAVLCVILMTRKEWKDVGKVFITAGGAAGVAIAIFPTMVTRIFTSNRGKEATSSLTKFDLNSFMTRVGTYTENTNKSFFGGLLFWITLLAVLLIAAYVILKKTGKLKAKAEGTDGETVGATWADILLVMIPAVCYFFLIIKIAPYNNLRYLYPVTAFLYLGMVLILMKAGNLVVSRKIAAAALCVIMAVMCGLSWQTGSFQYLYEGRKTALESALGPYRGLDAIQIWSENRSKICLTMPQREYFGSLTMYYKISDEELENISALKEGKDVLMLIGKEDKDMAERLPAAYPGYTMEPLGSKNGTIDKQERYYYYMHKETGEPEGAE